MDIENLKKLNKKQLKEYINSNGFFVSALIDRETNMPSALKELIPEGAMYVKGIASKEELSRNGYIIRAKAWKPAIEGYMQNPAILLQHDMDQPIGKVLTAKVVKDELIIEGYIFDELTGNRFSKGLFGAFSTGHLTEAIEFENTETGEIKSEEEFRAMPWEEKISDSWVMAVTGLDWLENSIVSIPANRKSLITTREVVKNYLDAMKKEEEKDVEEKEPEKPADEEVEPEKPASEEEKPDEPKPEDKPADEKPVDETEVQEDAPAEVNKPVNGKGSEESTVQVSKEEVEDVSKALKLLCDIAVKQQAEIQSLKSTLDNIPMPKGFVVSNGTKPVKQDKSQSWLGDLFAANGINYKH